MAAELRADEFDVLRRVEEAVARAVDRDEPLAALDVVEQRLLLLGGDLGVVRVDHQAVVVREVLRVEVVELVGVGQLDAACREDRLQLLEPLGRLVPGVVAEEEHLELRRLRVWSRLPLLRECRERDRRREHEKREYEPHRRLLAKKSDYRVTEYTKNEGKTAFSSDTSEANEGKHRQSATICLKQERGNSRYTGRPHGRHNPTTLSFNNGSRSFAASLRDGAAAEEG